MQKLNEFVSLSRFLEKLKGGGTLTIKVRQLQAYQVTMVQHYPFYSKLMVSVKTQLHIKMMSAQMLLTVMTVRQKNMAAVIVMKTVKSTSPLIAVME